MLTEADLNRIKGLLHFLNGNKPATRGEDHTTGRRLQIASPEDRERGVGSTIAFNITVRDSHGAPVGHITKQGDEYVFGMVIG